MAESPAYTRLVLSLLSLPRVGRKTALRIIESLGSSVPDEDALADALTDIAPNIPRMPRVPANAVCTAFAHADITLARCNHLGLRVHAYGDSTLPTRLWNIPDPPVAVFSLGKVDMFENTPAVAIIGTREPTDFGTRAAHRLAARCAESRVTVISGLAIGCDAAAHSGCLDADGRTVAVMAHGLDSVHPARNRGLAERITENGGCLISEYAPGVEARANQFVERDRLQSALSHGVLVIETDIKGGTMHTVGFARDQLRLLGCLSHPSELLGEAKTRGNQRLIRDGIAVPIADLDDLQAFIRNLNAAGSTASSSTLARSDRRSLWEDDDD